MSTYTPIASVTLSSAQSSVTFSGIPQTYTDLVIVAGLKGTADLQYYAQYNNDTGNNYSNTYLGGNGSSASSTRVSNVNYIAPDYFFSATANGGMSVFNIMNYSNSTTNKTTLMRSSNAEKGTNANVGLWRSTSAINRIDLITFSSTFASGTTFNLYGVANASITNTAKATGGDSVYTDGTYWYHIFRSSGTFAPTQALTADYLVVAGGGGAGAYTGGGGGGQVSTASSQALTAQGYTVTIGAGGAGGTAGIYTTGSDGNNSVFSSTTASKGLKAPAYQQTPSAWMGGGTSGSGNAGGSAGVDSGGGGGGAGAVGGNGSGSTGGNGGAGTASSLSGTSITYAGGGGGSAVSTGGTGANGGGNGGTYTTQGTAGTANTGGGGGGDANGTNNGRAGGSGIVIVRYSI